MSQTYTPYIRRRKNTVLFSQSVVGFYSDNPILHDAWAACNFSSDLGLDDFEKLVSATGARILEMTNQNGECILQIIAQYGALMDLGSVMRVQSLTEDDCNQVRRWARAVGNTFFLQSTDEEEQNYLRMRFSFPYYYS